MHVTSEYNALTLLTWTKVVMGIKDPDQTLFVKDLNKKKD